MKRRVFYSFHYQADHWRASQVRQIGTIEGNQPASDNDWEAVKKGGDGAIKNWIAAQLRGRSCTVVLVGSQTANRKWINHEITESWNNNMGVVGICIHGLKDSVGSISRKGANPFDFVHLVETGRALSSIVKCYDPSGANSKARYSWIKNNLAGAIEEAIHIRKYA